MVEGGSILHADHPRKWVIFARRFTNRSSNSSGLLSIYVIFSEPSVTDRINISASHIRPLSTRISALPEVRRQAVYRASIAKDWASFHLSLSGNNLVNEATSTNA